MTRALPVILVLVALSSSVNAQERLGLIEGTFLACIDGVELLDAKGQAPGVSSVETEFFRRQAAVASDRCLALADAPPVAFVDSMIRYSAIGLDYRVLAIGHLATSRHGERADVLRIVGQTHYQNGEVEKAIVYLNKVLALEPTDEVANSLLGNHFYERQDFERAIPFLRSVVTNASPDFDVYAALGDSCLRVGDLNCATDALFRASELKPADEQLALKVGALTLQRELPGRALTAFQRVAARNSTSADAAIGIGRSAAKLSLPYAAIAAFDRAAKLGVPSIGWEEARQWRSVGQPFASLGALKRAGDQTSSLAALYETASALAGIGKWDDARELVRANANRFENLPNWSIAVGDIMLLIGDYEAAEMMYGQYATLKGMTEICKERLAILSFYKDGVSSALSLLRRLGVDTPRLEELLIDFTILAAKHQEGANWETTLPADYATRWPIRAKALSNIRLSIAGRSDVAGPLAEALSLFAKGEYLAVQERLERTVPSESVVALSGAAQASLGKCKEAMQTLSLTRLFHPRGKAWFEYAGECYARDAVAAGGWRALDGFRPLAVRVPWIAVATGERPPGRDDERYQEFLQAKKLFDARVRRDIAPFTRSPRRFNTPLASLKNLHSALVLELAYVLFSTGQRKVASELIAKAGAPTTAFTASILYWERPRVLMTEVRSIIKKGQSNTKYWRNAALAAERLGEHEKAISLLQQVGDASSETDLRMLRVKRALYE